MFNVVLAKLRDLASLSQQVEQIENPTFFFGWVTFLVGSIFVSHQFPSQLRVLEKWFKIPYRVQNWILFKYA